MKILIYIIISILIYIYIMKNNTYILTRNHHLYFWGTIIGILILCYFMKYHKYHVYKFFKNLKEIDEKPYYSI